MASQRKSLKRTQLITPIEKRIFILRGERIMLSFDIAALYGIEPKALVQAVKRNSDRFPEDFMFQLSAEEFQNLKSQIVTSSWGGWNQARSTLCLYGTRGRDALKRSPQHPGGPGQRRDHARVCEAAQNAGGS